MTWRSKKIIQKSLQISMPFLTASLTFSVSYNFVFVNIAFIYACIFYLILHTPNEVRRNISQLMDKPVFPASEVLIKQTAVTIPCLIIGES